MSNTNPGARQAAAIKRRSAFDERAQESIKLVCAALVLAFVMLALRIASIW